MKDEAKAQQEAYPRQVREKAKRLASARQQSAGFWRHVAHVGSLGFVFVLPLVAGAALGRVVAVWTGRPGWALGLLLVGLIVGAVASWRLIRESIDGGDR